MYPPLLFPCPTASHIMGAPLSPPQIQLHGWGGLVYPAPAPPQNQMHCGICCAHPRASHIWGFPIYPPLLCSPPDKAALERPCYPQPTPEPAALRGGVSYTQRLPHTRARCIVGTTRPTSEPAACWGPHYTQPLLHPRASRMGVWSVSVIPSLVLPQSQMHCGIYCTHPRAGCILGSLLSLTPPHSQLHCMGPRARASPQSQMHCGNHYTNPRASCILRSPLHPAPTPEASCIWVSLLSPTLDASHPRASCIHASVTPSPRSTSEPDALWEPLYPPQSQPHPGLCYTKPLPQPRPSRMVGSVTPTPEPGTSVGA